MEERNYYILLQHRYRLEYDDIIGERYHFPKKYLKMLSKKNIEFVYYEPETKGEGVYFGYGKIGKISKDQNKSDHYFAEIVDYKKFLFPVPIKDDSEKKRELGHKYNPYSSVSVIDLQIIEEICLDGLFDKRKYMKLAIDEMMKSVAETREDGKATPKVGAVLVTPEGEVLGTAFRGELRNGDHAEYTLLDRKLRDKDVTGNYLFATLEPCANGARQQPKIECAQRIVNARIKRVWIGIEDPDPKVATQGIKFLEDENLYVRMFDKDLQGIIEEENKEFLRQAKIRAVETPITKNKEQTLLENTITTATFADFSQEALKKYISRASLKIEPDSQEFISLLEQKELIQYETFSEVSNSGNETDEFRRNDVMPFFVWQNGLNGNGSVSDTFKNNGERANIISYRELDDNLSYIDIQKGWVEKGQNWSITGRNKKSEVNSNSQGYHIEVLYQDKDKRTYSQEFFRKGIQKATVTEPELIQSIQNRYRPTGLGILLFGKNPRNIFPQAVLKVETRYGNSESEIYDFSDALVLIPDQIEEWLRRVLSSRISREKFARSTEFDYPIIVLREVIINALVHRDYDIESAKCYVIIDDDKIVVKSPGLPIKPITFEDFKELKAPSLNRNPKLMAIFNEMTYTEERGLGMSQMKSLPEKYHLPSPIITWEKPYIVISLPRNQNFFEILIGKDRFDVMNHEERNGLMFIFENKELTKADYAGHFHYNEKKAQRHLAKFVELGLINLIGKGPSSRYVFKISR